jgi:uncharacterized membrane protein YgdD (TMEM256/DUF423 family)
MTMQQLAKEASVNTALMWRRALWMRLGALSGAISVMIWFFANLVPLDPADAAALRLGAQVQFMHGMATFACATFMNIGARGARHAPAFFLSGILLFSGSLYAIACGAPAGLGILVRAGMVALIAGWLILAWSARDIDSD